MVHRPEERSHAEILTDLVREGPADDLLSNMAFLIYQGQMALDMVISFNPKTDCSECQSEYQQLLVRFLQDHDNHFKENISWNKVADMGFRFGLVDTMEEVTPELLVPTLTSVTSMVTGAASLLAGPVVGVAAGLMSSAGSILVYKTMMKRIRNVYGSKRKEMLQGIWGTVQSADFAAFRNYFLQPGGNVDAFVHAVMPALE